MKNLSKRPKLVIGIIVCIVCIIAIIVTLLITNVNNRVLFVSSHQSYAWGYVSLGYTIYSNGVIKEFNSNKNESELKSAKISKDELNQLKELANQVEDKYKKSDMAFTTDAGTTEKRIYSERLSKLVLLSKSGDTEGYNSSDASKEILELTNKLYYKYLRNKE